MGGGGRLLRRALSQWPAIGCGVVAPLHVLRITQIYFRKSIELIRLLFFRHPLPLPEASRRPSCLGLTA